MSMATIGTLQRLSASSLSALLLAEQAAATGDPTIAVIDVRDDGTISPLRQFFFRRTNLPPVVPFRSYRRAHQRLKTCPLRLPRHTSPHPRPPTPGQTDCRLSLRTFPTTGAGRCTQVPPDTGEDAANAGEVQRWKGAAGFCPG